MNSCQKIIQKPEKISKKTTKGKIGENDEHVSQRCGHGGNRLLFGAAGLFVKNQRGKKHQEHEEGRYPKYIFNPERPANEKSDDGTERPANIDQGVVNGISDRAHGLARRARRRSGDDRLNNRWAESRDHQHQQDDPEKWKRLPQRSHPTCAERAHQKISDRKREVGQGQRFAEAKAIGQAAAKNWEKPHREAEHIP